MRMDRVACLGEQVVDCTDRCQEILWFDAGFCLRHDCAVAAHALHCSIKISSPQVAEPNSCDNHSSVFESMRFMEGGRSSLTKNWGEESSVVGTGQVIVL